MNVSANSSTVSANAPRINPLLATLCAGLSLAVASILGSGGAPIEFSEGPESAPAQASASSAVALQPVSPTSATLPTAAQDRATEAFSGEEPSALWAAEARLVPLRGAPTWVWALPNDDARKIAASHDWDTVAAADRQAGLVVLAWAMKVIPEQEYWNGLCDRWISDRSGVASATRQRLPGARWCAGHEVESIAGCGPASVGEHLQQLPAEPRATLARRVPPRMVRQLRRDRLWEREQAAADHASDLHAAFLPGPEGYWANEAGVYSYRPNASRPEGVAIP